MNGSPLGCPCIIVPDMPKSVSLVVVFTTVLESERDPFLQVTSVGLGIPSNK